MSAAADQAVAGHAPLLRLTPSARALVHVIAQLIPEGDTMTPPIPDTDLAARTGYDRRSIITARDSLVAERVIRAVGGGRGRVASYELLLLPGAGADRGLPFLDLVRPRRAAPPHPTPLLDVPLDDDDASSRVTAGADLRASAVRSFFTRCAARLWQRVIFFHRLRNQHVIFFHTLVTSLRQRVIFFHRFVTFGHAPYDPVLAEDDARARGSTYQDHVQQPRDPAPTDAPPAVASRHPWHAWCDGRVHVPKAQHADFLRLHPRQAGETDDVVETWLRAFYARTCEALPTDAVLPTNEFQFWRRAYARELDATYPRDHAPPARSATVFGGVTICPHEPRCQTWTACRDRYLAEVRRANQGGGVSR